jgi:hypothetical protein
MSATIYRGPSRLAWGNVHAFALESRGNRATGACTAVAIVSECRSAMCGDCPRKSGGCYAHRGHQPYVYARSAGVAEASYFAALHMTFGRVLRLGCIGDPAAIPREALEPVCCAARRVLGYTHGWRRESALWLREWAMASTESAEETVEANARGFAAFEVVPRGQAYVGNGTQCRKQAEPGRDCASCLWCNGRGRNVWIYEH